MKKYIFSVLLFLIIISEVFCISSTVNASYGKNFATNSFQPQPEQLETINNINTTNFMGNLAFNTHIIYSKDIQLMNSTGIQSISLDITSPGIVGFNFTSYNSTILEQITYSFTNLRDNSTILTTYQSNENFIHDEVPIVSTPEQILFKFSATGSPNMFPLNNSLVFWLRDSYPISVNSQYQGANTYPQEEHMFTLAPQQGYNQLAFSLSDSFASIVLYNASGSSVWASGPNFYHWFVNSSETFYLVVTCFNFQGLSFPSLYQALFRVSSPTIHLNLSENTTIVHGTFLYYEDSINLTFSLQNNYQIRFTENGTRQYWVFWNIDKNQSYWQNWNVNGIFLNWGPTTESQVIDTNGNYGLQLIQNNGYQFTIKITLHYMPINLSKSKSYSGSIVGPEDFELWMINIPKNDQFSIQSSGTKFQLHLLDSKNQLISASMIGEPLNYTASQNGTYYIEVKSGGLVGFYQLLVTLTSPAKNTDFGFGLDTILLLGGVLVLYTIKRKKN